MGLSPRLSNVAVVSLAALAALACACGGGADPTSAPTGPVAPANSDPGGDAHATPDASSSPDAWTTSPAPAKAGSGVAACGDGPFGNAVGDVAENFVTYDQYGRTFQLSDHCDQWLYIEFGRMGCGACREHAPKLEAAYQADKGLNLLFVDALGRTLNPDPATGIIGTPKPADLLGWATEFGETIPVIADPEFSIFGRYWPFGPGTDHPLAWDWPQPQAMLIKPGGIIVKLEQIPLAMIPSYVKKG